MDPACKQKITVVNTIGGSSLQIEKKCGETLRHNNIHIMAWRRASAVSLCSMSDVLLVSSPPEDEIASAGTDDISKQTLSDTNTYIHLAINWLLSDVRARYIDLATLQLTPHPKTFPKTKSQATLDQAIPQDIPQDKKSQATLAHL
jgi:hypothetical protein